jgi:uncharacterized RDD family membrane protein YckC
VRYAGFWRRLAAHIIDSVILNLAAWLGETIVFGGMYAVYYILAHTHGTELKPYSDAFDPFATQIVNAVIYILLCLPYFVWGQSRYGTTLGKKLFKIYVVRESDLGPLTLGRSAVRFSAYLVSYATLGCGFHMAAFNPEKRGLHDLIAGTVSVIKEE